MITIDTQTKQQLQHLESCKKESTLHSTDTWFNIIETLECMLQNNPDLRQFFKEFSFKNTDSEIDEALKPYFQILLLIA